MKKIIIVIIVIIVILLSSFLIYTSATDVSFESLGERTKSMLNKENTDSKIVAYVNGETVYLNSITTRCSSLELLNKENIEYINDLIANETNEEVKEIYSERIKEIQKSTIDPSKVLDEKIIEILILQDAKTLGIKSDEKEIREQVKSEAKFIEEEASSGNKSAVMVMENMNAYYSSTGLTEQEILDLQVSAKAKMDVLSKHKIYVIEQKYGKESYESDSLNEQNDYYASYCNELKEKADIEYVYDVNEINKQYH